MCISFPSLAWDALLFILLYANFIVGIKAASAGHATLTISENDDSLAWDEGYSHLSPYAQKQKPKGIDRKRELFPFSIRAAENLNLPRSELVTGKVDDGRARFGQGEENSEEFGKKEKNVVVLREADKKVDNVEGFITAGTGRPSVGAHHLTSDYNFHVETGKPPNNFASRGQTKETIEYTQKGNPEVPDFPKGFGGETLENSIPTNSIVGGVHHSNARASTVFGRLRRDAEAAPTSRVSHYDETKSPPISYKTSESSHIIPLPTQANANAKNIPPSARRRPDLNDGRSRKERQTSPEPTITSTNTKNTRAREEGDAILGALFPLHQAPTQKTAYNRQCGEIREYYGIQRVEAFLMTIDKINNDTTILPNITLGWDIRDSCWYSAIALENSIDFIKDAIASQAKSANNMLIDSLNSTATTVTTTLSTSSSPVSSFNGSGRVPVCQDNKHLRPIVGLVGPGSSEATIQVQNLLQIFNIPQIGYSATSMDLSDKSHYKYFLRVVPPDRYQAQALVDIVVRFNWTYISTVHSDGNYGVRGMEKFTDLARAKGVCIATSDNVASASEDEAFDKVLDNLLQTPNATVVVCFCEGLTVKKLLKATIRRNMEGRFLILGSDGWGNRLDVVEHQETAAVGGISIKLYSPSLSDFGAHYAKLKPNVSLKNPWFEEFWEWKFKCSLDRHDLRGYTKVCLGNESLAGSDEDSKLGFVVNAVTTMAKALHNMHKDVCPDTPGLCPAMEPINGSVYLQYLLNVSFESYSGEQVHFDGKGDPPGRYEILNYQRKVKEDGNVTYDYETIGYWMTGTLELNVSEVTWPPAGRTENRRGGMVKSVCSEPCKRGQAKKVKGVACCWICTTCLEHEILVDNHTDCRTCDQGMWPNLNQTDCEAIPVDFISWGDTEAIVCITLACLGICVTLWTCAIFIRYNHTPIVKASTRELSYIIIVGICLAFSANFFIVAKPAKEFCYLTRILPGLSFSLMYGALVTRTNRIARILEGSKRIMTKKPRFMSATAQVVITGIIIGIECAVITGMLIYQPANSKLDYPSPKKVRLICDTSTLGIVVPLGFDLVLIFLCTIYAVKTRNLPENFNEAKFIGFTMYSTCVIWLGFFPIYFAGENKEITLSISMSLSAAIALLLLFMPKVYVIVWVPEKNTRGAFTTSRDVRCHIGSKSMASGDSIDIKESSTFDSLFKTDKHARQWRQKSLDEKRLRTLTVQPNLGRDLRRFVMQRTGPADGETPYINHGVLANHAKLKGTTFMERDSKDSAKTDTTPVSSLSVQDKDKLFPIEHKELPSMDVKRKSIAREHPPQKRQISLRPGSPAEKEKHRIHNVDSLVDFDELLGTQTLHSHGRPVKAGDFRKSLSSTCVSTCPKTRNAQCQTTDDLVNSLLPPLRKRYVSKNKNKLERAGAVDDNFASAQKPTQEINVFRYPSPCHSKSLMIQRSPGMFGHTDGRSLSPSELSETSPLVVCHNNDQQGLCFLPEVDIVESSSLLDNHAKDYSHHRHGHRHPDRRSHSHLDYHPRRGSGDLSPSSKLPLPDRRSSEASHRKNHRQSESSDFGFMDGVEDLENSINPAYSKRRGSWSRYLAHNFPEPGVSPSGHNPQSAVWCHTSDKSPTTPTPAESCSSATISTASSSSFTLPPFQTSTDSNPSQHTFGDSDDNFELSETGDKKTSDMSEEESENKLCSRTQGGSTSESSLANSGVYSTKPGRRAGADNRRRGDNTRVPNERGLENSVVPLETLRPEHDDDVREFQQYLQGHGVQLDLSTIQTSDL